MPFGNPNVKKLKERCREIAIACTKVEEGRLSPEFLVEIVTDRSARYEFDALFTAAAKDIGIERARNIAEAATVSFAVKIGTGRVVLDNVRQRARVTVSQLVDTVVDPDDIDP